MKRSSTWLWLAALAAILAGIQLGTSACGKDFYLTQLTMSAYYTIVALGLCLVMGYAGQVSLGHAAFFAIGGYTSAVLTTLPLPPGAQAGWLEAIGAIAARQDIYGSRIVTVTPGLAFIAALLLTAVIAVLIGYPALRLKGHYLAMATIGFGLIVYRLVLGSQITGSADGITSVPAWDMGAGAVVTGAKAHRVANYYMAWGATLFVLLLLRNLVDSRVGRALRAIHDGEVAANAMGINTAVLKLQAFVLSAVLAAGAGSLFTHFTGGIGPSEAGAMKSVRYVAIVAAGGMANLPGVLVMSTVLNFLSLRGLFGSFDHAFFGIILILIISWAPDGPLEPIGRQLRRWAAMLRPGRRSAAAGTPAGKGAA